MLLVLAVNIVLARLLTPKEFGIVAYALVFVGLSQLLSEAGLVYALVQKADLTVRDLRVAATLSLGMGLTLVAVLWAVAPWIPARLPEAIDVLRVLALTFAASSVGIVSEGLLRRKMDFGRLFIADVLSYLAGYALVAIVMAIGHYGVWSLAGGLLAQSMMRSVLLCILAPHSMVPLFSLAEARSLARFGIGLTLTRVANYAASNASLFLIGWSLGSRALGLYQRAYSTVIQPVFSLSSIVTAVSFSALAKIQHDKPTTRAVYGSALTLISLAVTPLVTVAAVASRELVLLVYGPQWIECSASLSILSLNAIFASVCMLGDSLTNAHGLVYQRFRREAIYTACVCVLVLAGARYSITWVAAAVAISSMLRYCMVAQLGLGLVDMRWRNFLAAQLPGWLVALMVALGMGAAGALSRHCGVASALLVLAAKLAGACAGCAVSVFWLPARWMGDAPRIVLQALRRVRFLDGLTESAAGRRIARRYSCA